VTRGFPSWQSCWLQRARVCRLRLVGWLHCLSWGPNTPTLACSFVRGMLYTCSLVGCAAMLSNEPVGVSPCNAVLPAKLTLGPDMPGLVCLQPSYSTLVCMLFAGVGVQEGFLDLETWEHFPPCRDPACLPSCLRFLAQGEGSCKFWQHVSMLRSD
jgi:hypothetical protein